MFYYLENIGYTDLELSMITVHMYVCVYVYIYIYTIIYTSFYDYGTYHEIAIDPGIGTAIIHRPETRDLILAQRSGELPGLVMTNIANWKITIIYGKTHYNSPFSMAMLVITRGYL